MVITEFPVRVLEGHVSFDDVVVRRTLNGVELNATRPRVRLAASVVSGDTLPDHDVGRAVEHEARAAIAVANAVDEVKQCADYVTTRPGGSGAVREVIEYILKNSGRWEGLMKRYLP